jgi:dihydrofolate reductase
MRKIIASTFLTLDGVMEAPGSGDTTLPEQRGWTEPYMNDEIGMSIVGAMDAADTILLGRKTYQDFAAFWPSIPDSDPFGQRMNNVAKVVVSTTLDKADWKNSTLIKGNLAEAITKLKQQPGKNISITGSGTLIGSLMQLDLIDEYQLLVFPVVLGVGKHLFKDGMSKKLKLIDAKPFSTGVVQLTYQPDTKA